MNGPTENAILLEMVQRATRTADLVAEVQEQQMEYIEVITKLERKLRNCLESMAWAREKLLTLRDLPFNDEYTRIAINDIAESLGPRNPRNMGA